MAETDVRTSAPWSSAYSGSSKTRRRRIQGHAPHFGAGGAKHRKKFPDPNRARQPAALFRMPPTKLHRPFLGAEERQRRHLSRVIADVIADG